MNLQSQSSIERGSTGGSAPSSGRRRLGPLLRLVLLVVVGGAIVAWAANWARTTLFYVHETDARIVSDMITVSSRVDGLVTSRPVEEGSRVGAGDVIATIDARQAELRFAELEAELASADAAIARLDSEIVLADRSTATRIDSARSKLAEARATREAAEQELNYAEAEFRRARALSETAVIAASRLDRTRADYLKMQQELARATAQITTAQAVLAEAEADRHRLDVLASERLTQIARRAEITARMERARLDIAERMVTSPIPGVVSRTFVSAGEYVAAGQRIALLHDPADIWIEARFRETDIRRLAVGQEVQVTVDAYPDESFTGHIERIGQAATSEFALLPTPNPSGNFTKVTQRLPVRIQVEQRDGRLRPGMMVEVYVDLHRR